jgi:hypothetical protein
MQFYRSRLSCPVHHPHSNVFHVVHEQRVPRMLHLAKFDQLWCVRDDGTISILDVSNGLLHSQSIVHMFKNSAGDRYVGEIKEDSSLADPMQMAIADDDTERASFVKEGHGELHYANKDLYVGQFRSNMRHGHGVFRQANGRRFFGQWKNDVRDGQGIDVQPDGTCFEGIFSKNVRKGCANLHISSIIRRTTNKVAQYHCVNFAMQTRHPSSPDWCQNRGDMERQ